MTEDTPKKLASTERVEAWVRPVVQSLSAYPVLDSTGMVKLDAMENPYQWPDEMTQMWLTKLRPTAVNRYPDPTAVTLMDRIHRVGLVPEGVPIIFGNGSDELIQIILLTVGGNGRTVVAPMPTFVMYETIARLTDTKYVGVPLLDDFSLDTEAMIAAVREHNPAAVILASPNNPTSNLFDREAIYELMSACNGLVVIDEAYHIFSGETFINDLNDFDNLIVLRTLSKMGLAGLRLGYMVGSDLWMSQFNKARLPFNVNVLTQLTAEFALQHYYIFEDQAERIRRERARVLKIMGSLDRVSAYPSDANFVLFRCEGIEADEVFTGLLQQEVLIKNLHQPGSALQNCLRVTIGKPHENDAFLNALGLLVNVDYTITR